MKRMAGKLTSAIALLGRAGGSSNSVRAMASKQEGPIKDDHAKKAGDEEKKLRPLDAPVTYDQITHTGQAWDEDDYRLARFEFSKKQVNPNIAAHLIAELPPIATEERVARCNGGHPELGHPRIYINLDKPGTHACGYCGQRFYNTHVTKGEDLKKAHIQV